MITIGRGIRWYNEYQAEVDFCRKHHFDFMQLWFKNGDILVDTIPPPKVSHIRSVGFPVILHAVFEPDDFTQYGDQLLDIAAELGHSEVIVQPVCTKTKITADTEYLLAEQAQGFSAKARSRGMVWYLENNSALDGFHCRKDEVEIVFHADSYVEQLLDVAHTESYQHLQDIVSVKFPKCLHVAGKHFSVVHEHLPLTQGDIDYRLVFNTFLQGFDGRIILEVDGTDEELIQSKKLIDDAIKDGKEIRI